MPATTCRARCERLRASGGEVAKLAVTRRTGVGPARAPETRRGPDGSASIADRHGRAGHVDARSCGAIRIAVDVCGQRHRAGADLRRLGSLEEFQFRRIRRTPPSMRCSDGPVARLAVAGDAQRGLRRARSSTPSTCRSRRATSTEFAPFAGLIGVRGRERHDTVQARRDAAPRRSRARGGGGGAVNTIAVRDGRWIGMNTDADGFLEPLRRRMPELTGLRAVVLGAGGAARAVGLALRREGARGRHRRAPRGCGAHVAHAIGAEVAPWPPRRGSWDLLVNATPVGSRAVPGTPFDGPVRRQAGVRPGLRPGSDGARCARREAAGCPTIGGLEMLVAQAERQFEIWTGQRPPAGLFAEAAHDREPRPCESVDPWLKRSVA